MTLINKKCVPCEDGTLALNKNDILEYLKKLKESWNVKENKKISKEFIFENFKSAMAFVNKVANLAEEEGHHPDIDIRYNKVLIELWTHAVAGLSENDFIIAAKIENI